MASSSLGKRRVKHKHSKYKEKHDYPNKKIKRSDSIDEQDFTDDDSAHSNWSLPRKQSSKARSFSALEAAASIVELQDTKLNVNSQSRSKFEKEDESDANKVDGASTSCYLYSLYWGENDDSDVKHENNSSPRSYRRQKRDSSVKKTVYDVDSDKLVPQCLVKQIDAPLPQRKRIVEAHTANWIQSCAQGQQFDHQIRTILNANYPCTYPTLLDDIIVTFILQRSEMTGVILNPLIDKLINSNDGVHPSDQPLMLALSKAFQITYGKKYFKTEMDYLYEKHHQASCLGILGTMIEKNFTLPKVLCCWISDCLQGSDEFVLVKIVEKFLSIILSLEEDEYQPLKTCEIKNPIEQLEALVSAEKSASVKNPNSGGRIITKLGQTLLEYILIHRFSLPFERLQGILVSYFLSASTDATQSLLQQIIRLEFSSTGEHPYISLINLLDAATIRKSYRWFKKHFLLPLLTCFQEKSIQARKIFYILLNDFSSVLFSCCPYENIAADPNIDNSELQQLSPEQIQLAVLSRDEKQLRAEQIKEFSVDDPTIMKSMELFAQCIKSFIAAIISLDKDTSIQLLQMWGNCWGNRSDRKVYCWNYLSALLSCCGDSENLMYVVEPTLEAYLDWKINPIAESIMSYRITHVLSFCLLECQPTKQVLPIFKSLLNGIIHHSASINIKKLFHNCFLTVLSSSILSDVSLDPVFLPSLAEGKLDSLFDLSSWHGCRTIFVQSSSQLEFPDPSRIARRIIQVFRGVLSFDDPASHYLLELLSDTQSFAVFIKLLNSRNLETVIETLDILEKCYLGTVISQTLWKHNAVQNLVALLLRKDLTASVSMRIRKILCSLSTQNPVGTDILWAIIIHLVKLPDIPIVSDSALMAIIQFIGDVLSSNPESVVAVVQFIGRNLFIRRNLKETSTLAEPKDSVKVLYPNHYLLRVLIKICDMGNLPTDITVFEESLYDVITSPVEVQVQQLDLLRALVCTGSTHSGLISFLSQQRIKVELEALANGNISKSPLVQSLSGYVLELYQSYVC